MIKIGKYFVVLTMSLLSCQSNKIDSHSFPSSKNVEYTKHLVNEHVNHPSDIIILSDVIVVKDEKTPFILHTFNRQAMKYADSFIRRGRGPEEEIMIQSIEKDRGNEFWYKTLTTLKKVHYNAENNDLVMLQGIDTDVDDLTVAVQLKGDNILGWNYQMHDKEFLLYSPEKNDFEDFGPGFPQHEKNLSLEENHRLHGNKQITVHPDKDLFAVVYMSFPMLRVFKSETGEIVNEFRLSGKQDFPYATIDPDATEDDILSLTENYFKVRSTKEYIYALYAGETKGELYPDLFAGPFVPSDFGQEIHVWTWKGEPVKSIKLDKRLFSFDVCPEDKYIVGISLSEPDYLFEFRVD